ncbi:MAG TPA: ABC transporter permease, partial [Candidatus Acidoferrales bacterium]
LTLALGIGVNTAIFTVVNAVLLRDLPYPDSGQLIHIFHSYLSINLPRATVSAPGFIEYERSTKMYGSMGAYTGYRAPQNLTSGDTPERVRCILASAGFFPTLGVQPALGRWFLAEEDSPGNNRVTVLSHALWQSRFAADPNVLSRKLTLDGADYEIVGVMPQGFRVPSTAELWIPIAFTPEQREAGVEYLSVVARMKPGVTLAQAQAELDSIATELRRQFNVPSADVFTLTSASLRELTVGDIRAPLLILTGAVGFVLLIACVNLANLLLARASVRRREISIRLAMGAGRWRIARQMLTESVLLSLAGGALGVLAAFWGLEVLLGIIPIDLPAFAVVRVDGAILAFTAALAVLTGIIFGAIPAWQATRSDLMDTLKEGGRGADHGGHTRTRSALVSLEVALALVLLVGAGLMLRSLARLQSADYGFDPRGVLTAVISLPQARYSTPELRNSFRDQLVEGLAALPGVESAGAATSLPLSFGSSASFFIEGRDLSPAPHAYSAGATPGYFRAMRIPLVRGRLFDQRDLAGSLPVAILDERAADAYWPGEDPIGKRIYFSFEGGQNPRWREVVGIVGAVKHTSALVEDTKGQTYYPLAQRPSPFLVMTIRARTDAAALTSAVRSEVLKLDAAQPVFDTLTMDDRLSTYLAQPRFNMALLGLFAALSLTLAAVGIYGVVSYSVSQRTHEIGIRVALGAQPGDVLRLVLRHGLVLALVGLAMGLAGSWALTRVLEQQLYQVSATDPLTFASVSLVLLLVALLAVFVPARRATRVDPMVALRYE